MVINILLNDSISLQRSLRSVYDNEDGWSVPTMTCSSHVTVLEFWRRVTSEGSTESPEPTLRCSSVRRAEVRVLGSCWGWSVGGKPASYHKGAHTSLVSLHPYSILLRFPPTSLPASPTAKLATLQPWTSCLPHRTFSHVAASKFLQILMRDGHLEAWETAASSKFYLLL